MLNHLQEKFNYLLERGLDRHLRIAVTGLSKSGKTAFITSLINQLLSISRNHYLHLPLFEAARNQTIIAVKRVPQKNLSTPRFDYEANMQELSRQPPCWPQSTTGISETRLAIRYQHTDSLLRHIKQKSTLYIDIFDYPGEWLLDLALLSQNFQQWSIKLAGLHHGQRKLLAKKWLHQLKQLDLMAPANEDTLAQLAKDYTDYLFECKNDGLHFIQPGRFVLPGELAGAPALQFFPLIHLDNKQWQQLTANKVTGSYYDLLNKRYQYYCDHIVKNFYQNYFVHFDRQIILADCLTPLNHSQHAFNDMRLALGQIFNSFKYGQRTLLKRLFSPRIDKLLFAASKADHITADQIPNLVSLMRELVKEEEKHIQFEGIDNEYSALASIRATQSVLVNDNGNKIKALQGIRSEDKKKVTIYPGSVPNKLPAAEFWENHHFEFDQFDPQPHIIGDNLPHLRMDAILQFLLADKLT